MRDGFSNGHPMMNYLFYLCTLIMGMCFTHPLFQLISLALSLCYYRILCGQCLKYLAGMGGLFLLISVGNPIFSPYGEHILFFYASNRPYTYEALCFGMSMAAMFVLSITWFATFNKVITGDKILFCFGKPAPSFALVLVMVLRFLPSFQHKAEQIEGARKGIGKFGIREGKKENLKQGMIIVSALTSWALEGGIIMADSMKSRGFGTGKRTNFSLYKMKEAEKRLIAWMVVLLGVLIRCVVGGGMEASYFPRIKISGSENGWTIMGAVCYVAFLSIPTISYLWEELRWYNLKSKI